MPVSELYDTILSMIKTKYPELELTAENQSRIKQMVDALSQQIDNQNLQPEQIEQLKTNILKAFIQSLPKK